jgi:hypothetical protein
MLRVFGLWLVMTVAVVGSAVAQSGDIDPVGTYEFSTFANNQTLTGTITISKTETGWSALLESPSGQLPPMTTTSVKVEGKNVTLTIPFGDVGEILIELTLEGDDLTGRWVLGMDSGELTGKRIGSSQ